MTNPQKIKGDKFERDLAEILNKLIINSKWKRIPGSGAIGTIMGEPSLTADIVGKVDSIPRQFKVECKVGYGGSKQSIIKKEWLDKIKMQAESTFGIPILAGKFLGSREGVQVFITMDVATFAELVNKITDLQEQLDERTGS
jgi:Holliday junction resolvase